VAALSTVEGDPIVQYLFVRAKRDVLVVIDTTRDAFGPRGWVRLRCTRLLARDDRLGWTGCRQTGSGKPPWLVPFRAVG
jgi:hypothetical protein